jgi:tetratricopeptide (TPR) repeat protein
MIQNKSKKTKTKSVTLNIPLPATLLKQIKNNFPKDVKQGIQNLFNQSTPLASKIIVLQRLFTFVALAIGIIILPLATSSQFIYPNKFPKLILFWLITAISFTLFLLRLALQGRKGLIQSKILNTLIVFIFLYIMGSIISPSPLISIFGIYGKWEYGLINIASFFLIILTIANNPIFIRKENLISWLFTISMILFDFSIIISLLKQNGIISPNTLKNIPFIAYPHLFTNVLVLFIPLNLSLIKKWKNSKTQIIPFLLLLTKIILILQSSSIKPVLVMSIGFILYNFYLNRKKIKLKNSYLMFALITCVTVLLLAPLKHIANETHLFTMIKNSIQNTLYQLKPVAMIIKNKPFWGSGPAMLHKLYPQYQTQFNPNQLQKLGYESFYTHITATTGLLGSFTFLTFLLLIFKKIKENFSKFTTLDFGYILGVITWFLTRLYSTPTITEFYLGAIFLGIFVFLVREQKTLFKAKQKNNKFLLIFSGIIAVICFYGLWNFYKAEKIYSQLTHSSQNATLEESKKIISLNPNVPQYYIFNQKTLINYLEQDPTRISKNEILRQINLNAQTAVALDRANINSYYSIADNYIYLDYIYPSRSYFSLALKYTKAAEEISPNNPYVLLQTANLYYLRNYNQLALDKITRAIELDDNCWEAYLFKANVLLSVDSKEMTPIPSNCNPTPDNKSTSSTDQTENNTDPKSYNIDKAEDLAYKVLENAEDPEYKEAAQNIIFLIEFNRNTQNN